MDPPFCSDVNQNYWVQPPHVKWHVKRRQVLNTLTSATFSPFIFSFDMSKCQMKSDRLIKIFVTLINNASDLSILPECNPSVSSSSSSSSSSWHHVDLMWTTAVIDWRFKSSRDGTRKFALEAVNAACHVAFHTAQIPTGSRSRPVRTTWLKTLWLSPVTKKFGSAFAFDGNGPPL